MFKKYELEKLLYVHPTFLGLWYNDSFSISRHLLQAQLVGHVLKDVGLVVIIVRVTNITPGNFDPTDGGVFARVRFVCYAFSPVSSSILKGKVDCIEPDSITVGCLGLPIITIPRSLLPRETLYNPEKRYFVWTKKAPNGAPSYFEIKQDDGMKLKISEILYGGNKQIAVFEPKTEPIAVSVIGDIRTYSLGPTHWWQAPSKPANGDGKTREITLEDSVSALNRQEEDSFRFLQNLRNESGC